MILFNKLLNKINNFLQINHVLQIFCSTNNVKSCPCKNLTDDLLNLTLWSLIKSGEPI